MNVTKLDEFKSKKPEICAQCHNKINPNEDRAYDIDDNRVCLSCFFAPLREAERMGNVICQVEE